MLTMYAKSSSLKVGVFVQRNV